MSPRRFRILILAFVLASVLLALGLLSRSTRPLSYYLEQAETAWLQKKFERAAGYYEEALRRYPRSERRCELWLKLGDIHRIDRADPEAALRAYGSLSEHCPKTLESARALEQSAQALNALQRHDEAIRAYERLKADFPTQAESADFQIARLLWAKKDSSGAFAGFKAILQKNPQTPFADQILREIGGMLFVQGKFEDAIQVYSQAIRQYPESALRGEWESQLAGCYEGLGRWKEALKIYESLMPDSDNPLVLEQRIQKLRKMTESTAP